jgi:chromosome segregation ATPase
MEQNEEVLIRVYQEKERQFKIQVDELKQKLQHAQQGESDLRKKLRQSDEYRQQLQRKCEQIERELTQLKTRLDEQRPNCDSCRRGHQQTQSIYENNCGIKPIPAPRLMNKEHDLRSEVDDLKSEVSMLRDQ